MKNGLFMINYSLFVNGSVNYVYERAYIHIKWYNCLKGVIVSDISMYNLNDTDYGYIGFSKKPKDMQVDSVKGYVSNDGLLDSLEEFLTVRLGFLRKKDCTIYRFDKWDSICPVIKFPEEPKDTIDTQEQINKIFGE